MPDVCSLNKSKKYSREADYNQYSAVLQKDGHRCAVNSLPDERSGPSAGSNNDTLFSFLHESHLQEAREFRRKGFNSQIPEVDPRLLTTLRAALDDVRMHLYLRTSADGPLDSRWLLQQITQIERLTGHLSGDSMQRWIKHEVPLKHSEEAEGEDKLGSRRQAQSLARRLESTLQTLLRVVYTLRMIDDHSTPEKREALLVTELVSAFSACDEMSVRLALQHMTSEPVWTSLVQTRDAAWETDKAEAISTMHETTRHEAKKANKKARVLPGNSASQAFFGAVATYFQSLSGDLTKALGTTSQSTHSTTMESVNGDVVVSPLPHTDTLPRRLMAFVDKEKLKLPILGAELEGKLHQLTRVIRQGHSTKTPSSNTEQVVGDSVIRSILWQWQQLAIQLEYASGAIWSKVKELKHIEGVFSSDAVTYDTGRQQEGPDTLVSHSDDDELDVQVRQWVHNRIEQAKPEYRQAEKLAVLNKLLDSDIGHARAVAGRLREKADDMQGVLTQQRFAVLKMIIRHSKLAPALRAVDELLPDVARELTASLAALEKACQAASIRDFGEAEQHAGAAKLRATKVKVRLSAASARLTERPLHEHSRGARLAKHWAALAKEQSQSNSPPRDAETVLSSLKKQGLLEGVLSTGDPEGYLFATRLAGELENAHHDELRLPMSPEQYTALEKGLVEYIVKWGQNRVSRGMARIIIELSFEQGLDAVSFSVSNLFRVPFKVLKASIKVPYNVNKVNDYTMPGHDKPYKAIYGMLEKKLKQLGFNIVTAPVPGMIKLVAGAGITAGAELYNLYVGHGEEAFSAVYERVIGHERSKKIKMAPVGGMIFDSVIDSVTSAAFTGPYRAWKSGGNEEHIIPERLMSVKEHNEVVHGRIFPLAHREHTEAAEASAVWEHVEGNESDSESVHDGLPLWQQSDVASVSDENNPASVQPRARRRREVTSTPSSHVGEGGARTHRKWHHHIPANAPIQSEHFDFDRGIRYQDFSALKKQETYQHAISFVLLQIEADNSLPKEIKNRAYLARMGGEMLVPVDIKGHKLNNTLLLPDSVGSKTGVLICLDAETPYYRIRQGSDLQGGLASAMPYNADNIHGQNYYSLLAAANRRIRAPSAIDILNHIRAGRVDFEENFNFNNPQLIDVTSLSAQLANTIEADYQLKSKTITNKLLISRGIAGAHIPADASLRANYDKGYQNLSDEMKKHTYAYAIGLILHEIENDNNLPPEIKARANLAKMGGEILVPFDMGGHKLNNTILLPDSEGSKHGVLITLDSETPYYHIRQVSDLPTSLASAMPYNANKMKLKYYVTHDVKTLITPSAIMILDYLRAGDGNFERYINHDNPSPMTISDLSNKLVDNIKEDYQLKRQVITNNLLMSRAIDGANILGEGFHLIDKRYHSDLTTTDHFLDLFSNHRLRELLYSIVDNNPTEVRVAAAEYLRSIERPFATLSRDMQSVISSFRGDTVQEANRHMHEAEYIGSWIDVTVGAITSLTPEGFAFNILQSAAGIGADALEGKALDPMAVANLVIGCTPEGKLATKIGKFSRIGGSAVKYGLMVGNKTLELAIVGESIKTAVKTGDPLAIYQALLASGMSVRSSYHMAKNMSSKLNISKNMEEIASLEQLEAIQENTPASRLSSTMTERRFRLGVTELLGRVNSGELEISSNNGVDWEKGSRLHLLAYRLQNAGGKNKLPVRDEALAFEGNLRAEEHASSAGIGREYLARYTSSVREYEPHTSGYQKNYSIYLNGINYLRTKMKLKMSKKDSRVQRFNEQTYTYENVNDYEVVPYQTTILDVDSRLDDGVVRLALNNMLLNYMSLSRIAEGYTGSSAVDFKKNIKMGAELLQEICRCLKEPTPSASSLHFLLIEKTAGVVTADNIIGIGKIVDLLPGSQAGEKGSIILESVIAHPYTLISKNEDFIRYAARQGLVVSPDDRARYNIKRVGSQLMHDGLKQTIQKINKEVQAGRLSRPESIQFSARNPITARMAETFGARRTDASTMDNEFMIVRAGRQSDIVLPEEHNIISFDGPRPSSRVPVRLKTPSSFLGADSSISFVGDNKGGRLVIQAHGAMANVNHLSAKELAIYLKGYTAAMGIDMKSVNMIVLRSCYSAVGGEWSTAQLLADRLGKNVTGYHGVITSQMTHNIPTAGKIFRPRKLGRGIIKAEHGHAFLHRTSAILLRMRSSLRRVPRSIEGSEFEARRPPQLNDSYKEFLTDTVALIEGDYNTALFGEKYKISIDDLLELMSSVDVNAEMSDEEFHLCFDKLFRPGLTRRNGTVKPGSVLFNKLFEYANPRFMQFPLNCFNVEEFSTNSRNEIHRGQKVLIDYSFNVQNKPDRSWVGLYRQKDLPGIDDPVIWRYLDRACSGIDIDTSSLNRGEYSVIFFYDDNYNALEYNVNFSII